MLPTNADDPLRTTDHEPNASPPGQDVTTETAHTPGPFVVEGRTGPHVPAQDAESMVVMPERGPQAVSVPGYEIEGTLGRGGMGVVYEARHLALKRNVALKMILAGGHASEHELARFRAEAEAVARLQHPNIVQVHEVGEADGLPYCALELVEGGSLAKKLAGAAMPPGEAARLVQALAEAMHLAHSRNIVHRDLKPANILLTADGQPKITDFGLARQLDSASVRPKPGPSWAHPATWPPSRPRGWPTPLGRRPTCMPSAASSMSASRAGHRSRGPRLWKRSSRCAFRARHRLASYSPGCPAIWRRSA